MMPKTIGELFRYYFKCDIDQYTTPGSIPAKERDVVDQKSLEEFKNCSTTSTCGWSQLECMVLTKQLLKRFDNHPHVVENILKGLVQQLKVIYWG